MNFGFDDINMMDGKFQFGAATMDDFDFDDPKYHQGEEITRRILEDIKDKKENDPEGYEQEKTYLSRGIYVLCGCTYELTEEGVKYILSSVE